MRTIFKFEKENQQGDSNCRNLFKDLEVYCSQGNTGKVYCVQCVSDAVMCDDERCQCHDVHSQCEYFQNISIFHQKLNSKVFKDFNPYKVIQKTHNIFQGILKIQDQIKEEFTYFGLNTAEAEISKIIKKTTQGKIIKGSDLKRFKQSRQNQKFTHFQDSLIKYKRLLQASKISVMELFNKLEQQIVQEHINYYQKKVMSEILDSQIVNTPKQLKILNSMINPSLKFEQTEKIFSHYGGNKMDMEKLREAYEKKQCLLFLIENNLGKKFGVYSESGVDKKKKGLFSGNDIKPTCLFSINCDKSQTSDMKRIHSRSDIYQELLSEPCLTFELFDGLLNSSLSYLKLSSQNCYYYINGYNSYNLNGVGENPADLGKCYRGIKSVQVFQVYFDKVIKKAIRFDNNQKPPIVQNQPNIQKKGINISTNACLIPKKIEETNPFPKKEQNKTSNIFSKNDYAESLLRKQQTKSIHLLKQEQRNDKEQDKESSENSDGRSLVELLKSNEVSSSNINDQGILNAEKRSKSELRQAPKVQQTKQQTANIKLHKSEVRPSLFSKTQSSPVFQIPKTANLFSSNIFSNPPTTKKEEKVIPLPCNIFGQK